MNTLWTKAFSHPQTYGLLLAIGLGYGSLLHWQGKRPVVWLGGGAIATVSSLCWCRRLPSEAIAQSSDLLNRQVFLHHLIAIAAQHSLQELPPGQHPQLTQRQAQQSAEQAQAIAERLAQREPELIPDLLEALHQILAQTAQVLEAFDAVQQIQTPDLLPLASQRLHRRWRQLQESCRQLQVLHDQSTLSALGEGIEGDT